MYNLRHFLASPPPPQVVLFLFTISDLDLGPEKSDPVGLRGPEKDVHWESIAEPFLVVRHSMVRYI